MAASAAYALPLFPTTPLSLFFASSHPHHPDSSSSPTAMLAYGSDSPRSSDGPVAVALPAPLCTAALPPMLAFPPPQAGGGRSSPPAATGAGEFVPLSLQAGNVVKLKGLPFKHTAESDVARFFAAFRFASASPAASIFLRRHVDGRLTGEVSLRGLRGALFFSFPPRPPVPEAMARERARAGT